MRKVLEHWPPGGMQIKPTDTTKYSSEWLKLKRLTTANVDNILEQKSSYTFLMGV